MKILNEKGKLFGIINIVDLFIIIFLIVAGGFAYFYSNTIIREDIANQTNKTYDVVLEIRGVDEEICKAMEKNKAVFDKIENVPFGTLVDFEYYPSEEYSISEIDASVKKVTIPDSYDAKITMKIKTGEDIYIGKQLSIMTKDFTASGHVIGIE